MGAEHLPTIGTLGLIGLVVLVVVLPQLRDPNVVAALEGAYEPSVRAEAERKGSPTPVDGGNASTKTQKSGGQDPTDRGDAESDLTEAEIDKATTVAELDALAKRAPKDPRVLEKLARAQA